MKLVKTVSEMDYAAIVRDPAYVLDPSRVRRYQKHLQAGRAMPPVFVSSAGCKCLDGEHRLEAAKLEGVTTGPACVFEPDSIGDARIFQLQTNGERRALTPEETAELVELLAAEEQAKQAVEGGDAQLKVNLTQKSKPAKTRGRPSEGKTKAVAAAAEKLGVSESKVKRERKKAKDQENTDPVSAELLKPPPSIASVIGRALVDLGAAAEKLEEAFRRMDAIAGEYGDKDSRWAVSGYTGRAMLLARQAKSAASDASEFITSVETAKKGHSARKTPVAGLYIGYGKDFHREAQVELGLAKPKSKVKAEKPAAPPADATQSDPTRMALARSAFARAELEAREKFPTRPHRSTTPEGDDPPDAGEFEPAASPTLCPSCDEEALDREQGFCTTCGTPVDVPKKPMGLSDPPKTGLKAPGRLRVEDPAGNLLAEGELSPEETMAIADAAGVGGGPPEEGDEPVGGF